MTIVRAVLTRNVKTPRRLLAWKGSCVVCAAKGGRPSTLYIETGTWPRDNLLCVRCLAKPRERCLIQILEQVRPDWRELDIHESSPSAGGASLVLQLAPGYSFSQYLDNVALGASFGGVRCEDLARMTFADESFDILVTQDVLEHVMEPELVFAEMRRVLRPGGIHIATFPWYPELAITRVRARTDSSGAITYVEPPEYHRSPVNDGASLVTLDWGSDVFAWAQKYGLCLEIHKPQQARRSGIDGEYREVFVFTRMEP
jgi:SAM-dependent methyltransferase